jgi:hypothetical protein
MGTLELLICSWFSCGVDIVVPVHFVAQSVSPDESTNRSTKSVGWIISSKDVFDRKKLMVWNIPSHLKQLNPTHILRAMLVVAE